jgi:hypothetical protein
MTTETATVEVSATETVTAPAKPVGRPRQISDKVLARAQQFYSEKKMTVAQIASLPWCNITPAALYYHLKGASPKGDAGVEMRPRGRKGLSAEQLAFLVAQFEAGKTLTEIREMPALCSRVKVKNPAEGEPASKKHMFSLATLSKAVKDAGFTPKRGRPASPVEDEPEAEVAAEAPEAEVAAEAPEAEVAAEAPEAEVAAEAPEAEVAAEAPMLDEASAAE